MNGLEIVLAIWVIVSSAALYFCNVSDAEWRLMIALARYGGLRTPSETLSLKWTEIDWQRERIRVTSPKTEHHEGRDTREIPVFPELVEPLRDVWEQAEPNSVYVISRHRPEKLKDPTG